LPIGKLTSNQRNQSTLRSASFASMQARVYDLAWLREALAHCFVLEAAALLSSHET
jgi:hypothetical protein